MGVTRTGARCNGLVRLMHSGNPVGRLMILARVVNSWHRGSLLAVLVAIAMTGCASAPRSGPYKFTVHFDGKCPQDATVEADQRNCTHLLGAADKNCVKVSRERSDVVEFSAAPSSPGEFEIYFDPFKRQPFRSREGHHRSIALRIDPATPPKTYDFFIVSDECPVLASRIIVQR